MAVFKCKMCGGTLEINNNESVAVCEYCGTNQTLPKLDDEKRTQLYDRANYFRRENEFDKAMGIYEMILSDEKTDSEAYWGIVLCRYGIEYVEDPRTHRRMPTVNRAQFTSIFDDEDYKSALQYADSLQKTVYEDEANVIDKIQKGILAISQKEEPFDVFICYKETDSAGNRTQDSVYAQDIYNALTKEGYKVFFSRITLEDKLGSAYEPYIFAALNSARVMIVVGTDKDYFNAVWVKNEWSRYLGLIKAGKEKTLIPVYKDISPYDMPEEFQYLQSQDIGKIGFIQDLTHGVSKLLSKKSESNKTTVPADNSANKVSNLVKVARISLEQHKWDEALLNLKNAMKINPDYADIYLYSLLAKNKIGSIEKLNKSKGILFDEDGDYSRYVKLSGESPQVKIANKIFVKKGKYKFRKFIASSSHIFALALLVGGIAYTVYAIGAHNFPMQYTSGIALPLVLACYIGSIVSLVSLAKKKKMLISAVAMLVSFLSFFLSFFVLFKGETEWAYDKMVEKADAYYEAGEYQKALDVFVCFDSFAYRDTICNSLFGDEVLADDVPVKLSYNSQRIAELIANKYIEHKDYDSLINMFFEDLSYDFAPSYAKRIKLNIPESDYKTYITAVNSLNEYWDYTLHSLTDYSCYGMQRYVEIQHALLHKLPEGTVNTKLIDTLYEMNGNYEFDAMLDLFEYKEIQNLLLYRNNNIYRFVLGKWSDGSSSWYNQKYIRFSKLEDGGTGYNVSGLETPDIEHEYYGIEDCVLIYKNDNEKVADVFKFTFIDVDTLECYCYENGKTYTLYRQ